MSSTPKSFDDRAGAVEIYNMAEPNVLRASLEPLSSSSTSSEEQEFDDFALECLGCYVKWHAEFDKTEISPGLDDTHGSFLNLPFNVWLECNSESFRQVFRQWSAVGVEPPTELKRCIGAALMTPTLLARLVGPSQPDLGLPPLPFKRGRCRWGDMYWSTRFTDEQCNDPEFEKASYKGTIACILQWYFDKYLCKGNELISAFMEPRAAVGISDEMKLAIGIIRELLILPRFGSMTNFWKVHNRMVEEGGKQLGVFNPQSPVAAQIRELLDEEREAAMLDILLDLGYSKGPFIDNFSWLGIEYVDS